MRVAERLAAAALALFAASCGGGGGDGDSGDPGNAFFGDFTIPGFGRATNPNLQSLTAAEVEQVLAGAVAEAEAQGAAASIAVVDRVGNVLAVYVMNGADTTLTAVARPEAAGSGLDGLALPAGSAPVGALAKAITGAYLSSSGNAFSTRTASQIVQANFNPRELNQAGGPLFGVQFSQLPCSDLSLRFDPSDPTDRRGPKRSPLGLAADPGGLPLYKDGVVVGGVGVIADATYGIDPSLQDSEGPFEKLDERIALAATRGFLPDESITAPNITVEGNTLRYLERALETELAGLASAPGAATAVNLASVGAFVPVAGYYPGGGALAGTAYGDPGSGYRPAADLQGGNPFRSEAAYVLVDETGANSRFGASGAADPRLQAAGVAPLSQREAEAIVDEALGLALAGRAQIRRPINSRLQVTVTVVDSLGNVLSLARTADAPIFGTDVSVQKARAALFFSSPDAASQLAAAGFRDYIDAMDDFVGRGALRGQTAFSVRGVGNLARPFYPDGINRNANGPLSRPFDSPDTTQNWSPFSTGLQFDLVGANIVQHVQFLLGASPDDTDPVCTGLPAPMGMRPVLANGLQIFAGSIPIYRDGVLVGAIGVSGDGIDQDDMVAALGFDRAARALGNGLEAGEPSTRSDRLAPQGVRLRYVSCPFGPFLGTDAQNVCEGV